MMARIRSIKPEFWRKDSEPWGLARTNLYVMQEGDSGAVKVGIAGHPVRRLSIVQCGNHRKIFMRAIFEGSPSDCKEVEKYVHRYFESTREWVFADLEDVLRVIEAFVEEPAL